MVFSSQFTRGARRLRLGTGLGLAVVAAMALYALAAGLTGFGQPEDVQIIGEDGAPADRLEMLSAAITGLPLTIALWRLMRMLREIEQGRIFAAVTVRELRGFALFVMISAVASILVPPIVDLAAAIAAGADKIRLTMTFDTNDFFVLLVSVLLFFVAKLFGEAQRIADENEQIV